MTELYTHRVHGRRPLTYLGAVVFAGLLVLALRYDAPAIYYIPLLSAGAMLLFMLIKNPVDGLRLLSDRLILSPWRNPKTIMLGDIDHVEVISWSDSADMKVHLRSGEVVCAYSGDIPPRPAFASALSRVGVRLRET